MEDDKRSEASPRPSQPTPFSIADILSRRTSCADKVAPAVSAPTRRSSGEYERVENDPRSDGSYDRDDRMMRYPRLSGSPELSVSRELDDILRRNLAQASLSGFAPAAPHPTQGATFEHHLEPLGKPLTTYQPAREPTETAAHRQQDEALDMSKNKYLGTWRRVTLPRNSYSNPFVRAFRGISSDATFRDATEYQIGNEIPPNLRPDRCLIESLILMRGVDRSSRQFDKRNRERATGTRRRRRSA